MRILAILTAVSLAAANLPAHAEPTAEQKQLISDCGVMAQAVLEFALARDMGLSKPDAFTSVTHGQVTYSAGSYVAQTEDWAFDHADEQPVTAAAHFHGRCELDAMEILTPISEKQLATSVQTCQQGQADKPNQIRACIDTKVLDMLASATLPTPEATAVATTPPPAAQTVASTRVALAPLPPAPAPVAPAPVAAPAPTLIAAIPKQTAPVPVVAAPAPVVPTSLASAPSPPPVPTQIAAAPRRSAPVPIVTPPLPVTPTSVARAPAPAVPAPEPTVIASAAAAATAPTPVVATPEAVASISVASAEAPVPPAPAPVVTAPAPVIPAPVPAAVAQAPAPAPTVAAPAPVAPVRVAKAAAPATAIPAAQAVPQLAVATALPVSLTSIGKLSLGMSMSDAKKALGSYGEDDTDEQGNPARSFLISDGHAYIELLTEPGKPDVVYGIEYHGGADAKVPPILGVHLGDGAADVLTHVGQPSSRSPAAFDRTRWSYEGRNYSFELSSGGDLITIRIVGYEGLSVAPSDDSQEPSTP